MNSNINNSTKNVIFYVDGLNLYYGLKHNGWKKYYWLNISKFCCCFLKYYQKPVAIKYFNAPPKENQKKIKRYNKFISANETESLFEITEGVHVKKNVTCSHCSKISTSFEEKETDVNIAVAMLRDAVIDKINDISIIISADSDFVPVIKTIKEYNPRHRIFVYFPPTYFSYALSKIVKYTNLERYENIFKKCLFPNKIKLHNGSFLEKPTSWTVQI